MCTAVAGYTMFTPDSIDWIAAPPTLPAGVKVAVIEGHHSRPPRMSPPAPDAWIPALVCWRADGLYAAVRGLDAEPVKTGGLDLDPRESR